MPMDHDTSSVPPTVAIDSVSPGDPAELLAACEANIRSGQLDISRVTLPELISPFANDPGALLTIAEALIDRSAFGLADDLFDHLLIIAPGEAKVLQAYARSALRQRDWQDACRRWEIARQAFPNKPWAHAELAAALMLARRLDRAAAIVAEAVRRFPDDADIACQSAQLATAQGDLTTSIDRWAAVRDRFPNRIEGYTSGASVLRDAGRAEEAEALLEGARSIFETNFAFMFGRAWNATRLAQWSEAFRRWNAILESYPQITSIDQSIGMAITLWRHAQAEGDANAVSAELPPKIGRRAGIAGARSPESGDPAFPDGSGPLSNQELMERFESLGDRCEFGLVQRHFGAEPMGLLRWCNISVKQLVALLECRLDGVGDRENTYVWTHPETNELFAGDRRFFVMHTFSQRNETDEEVLLSQVCRKAAFLAGELLDELEAGEKVFVHRKYESELTDSEVETLSDVFARNFPASRLLLIRQENDISKVGTVEAFTPNVMIGYLSGAAPDLKGGSSIMFDEWRSICVNALALVDQIPADEVDHSEVV